MQGSTKKVYFYIAAVCLIIVGLWFFSSHIAKFPESKGYTVTNMADAYSGVNALFAGLAFGGVIVTIILQNSDLNDANKELARTAAINAGMLDANKKLASNADERALLEMFHTYCSEYFQVVKDSSMSVLIACVASREYCEFVATRFFVAGQRQLPPTVWDKVHKTASRHSATFDEFSKHEQHQRYKLDELINFFTLLVGRSNASDTVARCDISYSWWRPLLWLIATAQQHHYDSNPVVRQYATPLYLRDTLVKLDRIYGFEPFLTDEAFWDFFLNHPKILGYGMDAAYQGRGLLGTRIASD